MCQLLVKTRINARHIKNNEYLNLEKEQKSGNLSALSTSAIIKLTYSVAYKLTMNQKKVQRKVGDYMGGKVLDLPEFRIYDQGKEDGIIVGRAEGEQERKALEQIRKIVAGLGENSYVATAFEGCFEDAEENIENDFALSMNGRWQDAEQKIEQYKAVRDELVEENKQLATEVREANEDAEYWHERYNNMSKRFDELGEINTKNWNNFREQEDRVEALEAEIIKLKAKLYDLMVADK